MLLDTRSNYGHRNNKDVEYMRMSWVEFFETSNRRGGGEFIRDTSLLLEVIIVFLCVQVRFASF